MASTSSELDDEPGPEWNVGWADADYPVDSVAARLPVVVDDVQEEVAVHRAPERVGFDDARPVAPLFRTVVELHLQAVGAGVPNRFEWYPATPGGDRLRRNPVGICVAVEVGPAQRGRRT